MRIDVAVASIAGTAYSILEKPRVLQYILSTLHNYVDSSWDGALRIFSRILTETSFIIPLGTISPRPCRCLHARANGRLYVQMCCTR